MKPKSGKEIREVFLSFFEKHRHKRVPSSSLVPEGDPTLLLTNAGMNQFKPYFLGTLDFPHEVPWATSCQKCFRTGDLEKVGFTPRHHTFFEMLGNFSFGGYFKKEAITFAWEFLIDVLRLDRRNLYFSVYREDEEARELWKKTAGVTDERVFSMGEESNFWTMGPTGPCGPCSEIYVDLEPDGPAPKKPEDLESDRFLEIWNLVFTQYDRKEDGTLALLPKPNIDTGMGLERVTSVVQGVSSNYETDLLAPLVAAAAKSCGIDPASVRETERTSLRVIADHLRAVAFLVADGVLPSNEGRGYVLRRILRRAVRHGLKLGKHGAFFTDLLPRVVELFGDVYPELQKRRETVLGVARGEEKRFLETLESGMKRLQEKIEQTKHSGRRELSGKDAFELYDTYGFPLDLTEEILREHDLALDRRGFDAAMEKQREKARTAWTGEKAGKAVAFFNEWAPAFAESRFIGYEHTRGQGTVLGIALCSSGKWKEIQKLEAGEEGVVLLDVTPFYAESGGQVGDQGVLEFPGGVFRVEDTRFLAEGRIGHFGRIGEGSLAVGQRVVACVEESLRRSTMRHHTATHLLQAALKRVLGAHVEQAGSYVGPDRLRFDFTHFQALTQEEIRGVEALVNQVIFDNRQVVKTQMAYAEALQRGALAFFQEKYGETVRVVDVPGFSLELCGGTHVHRTGDIGLFKIVLETSVASGVRRIEAIAGEAVLRFLEEQETRLKELSEILKAPQKDLAARVQALMDREKAKDREIERLQQKIASQILERLLAQVQPIGETQWIFAKLEEFDASQLRRMVDELLARSKEKTGVALAGVKDGKVFWVAAVTKDLATRAPAGEWIRLLAHETGGSGGGKPFMAQAGGKNPEGIPRAFESALRFLKERFS